jgi:hypothetical protein
LEDHLDSHRYEVAGAAYGEGSQPSFGHVLLTQCHNMAHSEMYNEIFFNMQNFHQGFVLLLICEIIVCNVNRQGP